MKRILHSILFFFALLCSISTSAQGIAPNICPQPKTMDLSNTDYVPYTRVQIACGDKDAVKWTENHLREWYDNYAPAVERVRVKGEQTPSDGYTIDINDNGIAISATTLQGVRYALYSLRQIAIPARGTQTVSGWIVPKGKIEDEPSFGFRGMHICWFHETEPWEIERQIRLAAYYKLNYMVIESWGSFRSDVAPWFDWPDGTMTKEEIHRLKAIADDLGITLIPQINVFGHASMARGATGKHAIIDLNPIYQPLFEPVGGWNWCLTNPKTRELLISLIAEMHEAFGNPPYFHIGCDEADSPSCPSCKARPYGEILVEHLMAINDAIKKRGAHTMMWHDMLLSRDDPRWKGFYQNGTTETAQAALKLSKDIVICDWFYYDAKDSYPTMDYFKELGYSVLTCPFNNSKGIIAQSRYAYKAGIDGVLGTTWHHNFGGDLTNTYFYVANASWNTQSSFSIGGMGGLALHSHLRQIGWDMHVSDPRHTGIYYDEIPPEPELRN